MNKEEIVEGNKLIAEFLGMDDDIEYKFHSSWDWLIPVVDRIATEHKNLRRNTLYFATTYDSMCQALGGRDQERLFRVVVRFIKKADEYLNRTNDRQYR